LRLAEALKLFDVPLARPAAGDAALFDARLPHQHRIFDLGYASAMS